MVGLMVAACLQFPIVVYHRHLFSFFFPWIKLLEESGDSKPAVICLYCDRFASTFKVVSSGNRIDASPYKFELPGQLGDRRYST